MSSPAAGDKAVDLNDPTQRFKVESELAPTLQGRIYGATDLKTAEFVVIKETWKSLLELGQSRDGTKVPEDFFTEVRILERLSLKEAKPHPNFVHLIHFWEEPQTFNYAMEGCKDGDLFDFVKAKHLKHLKQYRLVKFLEKKDRYKKHCLRNNTKDEWIASVKHMFRQLVDCLSWWHDRKIAHMDMSLENTMVYDGKSCTIKIIDFGLAHDSEAKGSFKNNKRVGKRGYMAPEVYGKQSYDCRAADIWSLGVMLYMMLIGAPPYELPLMSCASFKYLINGKLRAMLTHWKRLHYVTDDIINLLESIFRVESKRITMKDIRNHPFVNLVKKPLHSVSASEEKIDNSTNTEQQNDPQGQNNSDPPAAAAAGTPPANQIAGASNDPSSPNNNNSNNSKNDNNKNNNNSNGDRSPAVTGAATVGAGAGAAQTPLQYSSTKPATHDDVSPDPSMDTQKAVSAQE